jgi:hypothetical protein
MNWYNVAQNQNSFKIIPFSELSGYGWMDNSGNIYSIHPHSTHSVWAIKNRDAIEDNYNIDIKEESEVYKKLIQNGWGRIRVISTYYFFEIYSFDNSSLLKKIGDKLFFIISEKNQAEITICEYKSKKCSLFKWQDFIQSGENFVDFVRSQIK